MTERHMDEYIRAAVGQLQEGEARLRYLLRRLRGTVQTVVANVAEELRQSSFVPLAFELSFRDGGALPAITIREAGTDAVLWVFRGYEAAELRYWPDTGRVVLTLRRREASDRP